jgi:hypothetical protein
MFPCCCCAGPAVATAALLATSSDMTYRYRVNISAGLKGDVYFLGRAASVESTY